MTSTKAAPSAGALTAIMTGVSYATSAEMAQELGPFPGYAKNREHMLRVMRNHRRAAHGEAQGYEKLSIAPVPLDHTRSSAAWRQCRAQGLSRPLGARQEGLGPRARARRAARLPQRAVDRDRADRHDRPGDGLRHHRHRAGLRAGQVQEARRRRLLEDHQPRRAGSAAHARLLAKRRIAEIEVYAVGHGNLAQAPGINHTTLKAKGFTDEAIAKIEKALPTAFDIKFAFNKWTLGRSLLPRHARHFRRDSSPRPPSTCWPRSASPSARSRPPTSTSAAR